MEAPVPPYLRDHARQLASDTRALGRAAIRQRTPDVLDLLALITSSGRADHAALLAEMREVVSSGDASSAPRVRLPVLARTARTTAALATTPDELTGAADLFRAVRLLGRLGNHKPLPRDTDQLDAQTNLAVGRVDYVAEIVPELTREDDVRWVVETELLNPVTGRQSSTYEAWLDGFNRAFEPDGLTPIALVEGDGTAFDRIITAREPAPAGQDGPLVSIVMSVFKPDQSLYTALRSIAGQTWTNLEVLVVDDCSPEEFQPLIADAVAMDDRFTLHRMPENGGTYAIRNMALARARGEFLGFQDSDDWSHPERVERQVQPMLAEPDLIATLSRCLSVDDRLSLNHIGRQPSRPNSSSLLMRRAPVVDAMGGFDRVRKGADSEFIERLQVVFGGDRIRLLEEPLAIVQLTTGSLSRDELVFGWHDGNRVAYRDAFSHWHQGIERGERSALLSPAVARPFPAPSAFFGRGGERQCDVMVVSDWRGGFARAEGAADEVSALSRAGSSTVLVRAEPMRFATVGRQSPAKSSMNLRARGAATVVRWEDAVTTAVALVRDPELLSYPPRGDSVNLRAARVVINAPFPPRGPADDSIYDPAVVEANARALFGGDVVWQPASADIAEALVADGARAEVWAPRVLGVVPLRRRPRAGRRAGGRLVIGTTGLEARRGHRPTWPGLLARLPDDDRYDVRIRDLDGALDSISTPRAVPPNWLITNDGASGAFLRQLDVFVGYPTKVWGPAADHSALEALAHGCVLVLDPSYESIYGDAALYLDRPAEALFDALAADRAQFIEQQQRGYEFISRELSPEAFTARLDPFISTVKQKESA